MKIPIYQVDAFTDELFGGNPAAVCPLPDWLPDDLMQKIAAENNLAETAFIVKSGDRYMIRWFTPKVEVDLCGHATLASAYVIFEILGFGKETIYFDSPRSGELSVSRSDDLLVLDFPADKIREIDISPELRSCFDVAPDKAFMGKSDYMLVYPSEELILNVKPDFNSIKKLGQRGVIITAPGENADFVSRFFAPQSGIDEDPVTGSAHTTLTPYWSGILAKKELSAIQLSERRGSLSCADNGERIKIGGKARLYLIGEIFTDQV